MIVFSTFLLGFSFGGSIFDVGLDVYLIIACTAGAHAYTTIMDYEFDKNAGYKTTAVVFGERGTSLLVLSVFIFTFCVAKLSPLIYPPPFFLSPIWSITTIILLSVVYCFSLRRCIIQGRCQHCFRQYILQGSCQHCFPFFLVQRSL
jgi:4-hydroxybenzoate polyprenyltransferase